MRLELHSVTGTRTTKVYDCAELKGAAIRRQVVDGQPTLKGPWDHNRMGRFQRDPGDQDVSKGPGRRIVVTPLWTMRGWKSRPR